MKFGLALPYNQTRHMGEMARQAEAAGWDGLFLGDAIWTEDPMIGLAAAAMTTSRIRLGTMIIPVPLRSPWKIASESLALDQLSDGRLILGLATGAVWMGWQGFPGEVGEAAARGEMLEETIEILGRLNRGEQFDYEGKHFPVKLSLVDPQHYPPKTVQQPRVPIWAPLIWPREASKARILKCDGLFAEKWRPGGKPEQVTPQDIREMKAFVEANRTLDTPFDIVVSGSTAGMDRDAQDAAMAPWVAAGATWWVEDMFNVPREEAVERIMAGPPRAV